jgi:hypothetical protein
MAVPLGGILLAISALYWFEFSKTYALPVSFTSPGVLAGLPALAAAVAATVAVLSLASLMPAVFLSMPVDGKERTLLHGHQQWALERKQALQRGVESSYGSLSLPERWGLISVAIAVAWPAIILGMTQFHDIGAGPFIWGLLAIVLALAYWLMWDIYKLARSDQTSPWRFVLALAFAVASQMLVVFWVYFGALKMAPNDQPHTLVELSGACMALSITVALAQLITAYKMVHGWSPKDAKIAVLLAIGVMALPLLYPPFGGRVAAYPLRISSQDGRECVLLYTSDSAPAKTWADIADPAHPDQSQPIWFATRLDDTYYAKLTRQSPTQLIPASQVRKVGDCPAAATESPPASGAPAKAGISPQSRESDMTNPALWISAASMLVALLSLVSTIRAWRQSNRPLLTARITTHDGGNEGIALNLLIENTGTRPALDVSVHADEADIRAAMASPGADHPIPTDAKRVFFSNVTVPVLANGRNMSNAFGSLGNAGVWRAGATIPIEVSYRGMTGPHFKERFWLLLSDDAGFAQTYWAKSDD